MTNISTGGGEDLMRRLPPPRPYNQTAVVLSVSTPAVLATAQLLRRFPRIESCCLWYGRDLGGGSARVEAVVAPKQRGTWGNYDVLPASLTEVSAMTRPKGWVALAQIHSHPSALVEHSTYDDQRAISRSMLSLVFPYYGRWNAEFPRGIGVHEFQIDYWHTLSDRDAAGRIRLIDDNSAQLIDLRQ